MRNVPARPGACCAGPSAVSNARYKRNEGPPSTTFPFAFGPVNRPDARQRDGKAMCLFARTASARFGKPDGSLGLSRASMFEGGVLRRGANLQFQVFVRPQP